MPVEPNMPGKVQIRLSSSVELMRAALEPYLPWIEQQVGVSLDETLTVEVDCNPGDAVAGQLLARIPAASSLKARNRSWEAVIEGWSLPPGVNPRVACSMQRERKSHAAPCPVWELDWQDCPVAFKLKGLKRRVVSVKVPLLFPAGDRPILSPSLLQHWFIAHREDAARVLLLKQQVQCSTERCLETAYGGLGCKRGTTGTRWCWMRLPASW